MAQAGAEENTIEKTEVSMSEQAIVKRSILSVDEVADILRCSRATVYRLTQSGYLLKVRPGFVSRNSLVRFIDAENR